MNHKLKLEPQTINKHNWFYDGQNYFTFVHEVYDKDTGDYIQTDEFKVNIEQLADFICDMTM